MMWMTLGWWWGWTWPACWRFWAACASPEAWKILSEAPSPSNIKIFSHRPMFVLSKKAISYVQLKKINVFFWARRKTWIALALASLAASASAAIARFIWTKHLWFAWMQVLKLNDCYLKLHRQSGILYLHSFHLRERFNKKEKTKKMNS